MAKQGTTLTTQEKYTIRGMLEDGHDAKSIAKELGRTRVTIDKYIATELENFAGLQQQDNLITGDVYNAVLSKLLTKNLSEMDAKGSINKVRDKLRELKHLQQYADNVDWVVEACMKQSSASQMMSKETVNKKKGVAIMSRGASERLDMNREKRSSNPQFDHCIYRQP